MPMQKPTKPGNAPIVKVGHTVNNTFGNTPSAQVQGRPTTPSEQSFGK